MKKQTKKQLTLKKITISNLDRIDLNAVRGGSAASNIKCVNINEDTDHC